ncbi:MAG: hypothetical protein R2755_05245 [Acidimicrobiales bacterium]
MASADGTTDARWLSIVAVLAVATALVVVAAGLRLFFSVALGAMLAVLSIGFALVPCLGGRSSRWSSCSPG